METLPIIPRIDYKTGQSLKSTITRLMINNYFTKFKSKDEEKYI